MMICCAFDNDWIEEKCLILIGLWVRSSLDLHLLEVGLQLDDGNLTWIDFSSAAEWLTGKSSSSWARLAHEFDLIRTIE